MSSLRSTYGNLAPLLPFGSLAPHHWFAAWHPPLTAHARGPCPPTKPSALPPAQDYGFKPGTSLIGCFGTTERRFDGPSYQACGGHNGPGPAYNVREVRASPPQYGAERRKGFGSEPRAFHKRVPISPGPGAYELSPGGASLMQRAWPNLPGAAAFSNNDKLRASVPANTNPGPGAYDPSADRGVARSPSRLGACWTANARERNGHIDPAKSVGRRVNWKGHPEPAVVSPGPVHYVLPSPSDAEFAKLRREAALRGQKAGARVGFLSSNPRVVDSGGPRDLTPGPLTYSPATPFHGSPARSLARVHRPFDSSAPRTTDPSNTSSPGGFGSRPTPGPGCYPTHLTDQNAVGASRSPNRRLRNPANEERRGRIAQEHAEAEAGCGRIENVRGQPSPHDVLAYLVGGGGGSVVGTSVHSQSLRGQLSGVVRVTL